MQKPHFVFLNQYYPPDMAATGVMLRDVAFGADIAKGLEERHRATNGIGIPFWIPATPWRVAPRWRVKKRRAN